MLDRLADDLRCRLADTEPFLSKRLITHPHALRAVALPQRLGHVAAALRSGRQFLAGHDDDHGGRIERVEHRRVRARHVEHRDAVACARRAPAACACAVGLVATLTGRARRGSTCTPHCVFSTRPPEERLVHLVHVLERVEHREARLGAQEQRGVAVRHVQVDEQRVRPGASWPAPPRCSRPACVVPTPPLAPTNASTWPARLALFAQRPGGARLRRATCGVIGSARHSFTPARIASSMNAGRATATRSTTTRRRVLLAGRRSDRPAADDAPRTSRTTRRRGASFGRAYLVEIGRAVARRLEPHALKLSRRRSSC